jgi:uncharacterized protein YndB with AHSA1/START domain
MERSIKHQYFFAHSPEKVWQYLTNSDLMELWLMKNNFQPVVGTDFEFRIAPMASLDFDGIFYCTVLEIEPFNKLSYSWKAGPGEGKITLDSVVIWKLEPTADGTNVFLEHNGFAKEENLGFFDGFNHGWLEKFEKIANLINA